MNLIQDYTAFKLRLVNVWLFIMSLIFVVAVSEIQAQVQAQEPERGFLAGQASNPSISSETGLLFYLSGEKGTTADFSGGGQLLPNYVNDVKVIADGAYGKALELDESMQLTYWAPGNIYAQRGTLSFFWRSRYPVGPTEFTIFRVSYADHSSHDMTWLRIDYNGSGFDAFVTDVGLARTRISWYMDEFPDPDEWIHLAFSWDETEGIRLYVNGELAGKQSVTGKIYDAGLDQMGPHHRYISPHGVRNDYNFGRTGDLDELRIYDQMLSDENISELSRGKIPTVNTDFQRDLKERKWRDIWGGRHGWNLPNEAPPVLNSTITSVRKVEIHDAIDIKRWFWKANDGIRETTWPGVYNMSRLPGRFDYFNWPDWDTYSMSGQTIKFHVPEHEQWNHIEMWGKAWGQLTHESDHPYDTTFAVRKKNQVKSYHRLSEVKQGGKIRFDNALIEEPIGSFMLYHVNEESVPQGMTERSYELHPAPESLDSSLDQIVSFINGRHPSDEQMMMLGVPEGSGVPAKTEPFKKGSLPIIHIMVPYEDIPNAGLDGIVVELPGLNVEPTHDGVFPLNIRIKDPLWEMRDILDYSFSVNPGTPGTLWFDTRDLILPEDRGLYVTISGAGSNLTPELLKGGKIRMIYKSHEEAIVEHELDRFTQMRDIHANNTEASPRSPRLNNYNRFHAISQDILKNNPDNWLTQAYWYWTSRDRNDRPEYEINEAPDGVPEWAHLQVEHMRHLERIIKYYIEERQISNGEFGGGLSDDGDFTNFFPAVALLGVHPDKILKSLNLHMEGYFDQDRDSYDAALRQRSLPLFTNGIATIQSDELHSYEDGNQVIAQLQILDYGTPLHFNRGMETAKQMLERITQISPDGHRRFRSRYYGGTKLASEDPWQWQKNNSFVNLHTALLIAKYNGNPKLKQMIIELADGLLATQTDEGIYTEVHFETGETRGNPGIGRAWNVMMAAYDLTGNDKYLQPITERPG
ncbi:MAG: LamG-like jellyroll fold domain-containing protein, partial [Balneolales bacterium]